MAEIAVTARMIGPVHPSKAEIYDLIAAEAITPGLPVYINAAGKAGIADANGQAPINTFFGIALNSAGIGGAVSVLKRGTLYGVDLSTIAYGGMVYVSDNVGKLADTTGTTTLVVGQCIPLADKDLTKVLLVG